MMRRKITLVVNGKDRSFEADAREPLLYALRHELQLYGPKYGCGLESCGACRVLVDGEPRSSCTMSLDEAEGHAVTTVEGIGTPEHPHPLQTAFLEENAGQCGYCIAGILVTAKALLDRNRSPSRADITHALRGNLCRCGSHPRYVRAVQRAAATLRGEQLEERSPAARLEAERVEPGLLGGQRAR